MEESDSSAIGCAERESLIPSDPRRDCELDRRAEKSEYRFWIFCWCTCENDPEWERRDRRRWGGERVGRREENDIGSASLAASAAGEGEGWARERESSEGTTLIFLVWCRKRRLSSSR